MNLDKELAELKLELKCWESMFSRKFGKKPSKEDVDQAPEEVKDAYKRYAVLKKACDPGSIRHEKENTSSADSDVFGKSFNKSKEKSPTFKSHLYRDLAKTIAKTPISRIKRAVDVVPMKPLNGSNAHTEENGPDENCVVAVGVKITTCLESSCGDQPILVKPLIASRTPKWTARRSAVSSDWLSKCNVSSEKPESGERSPGLNNTPQKVDANFLSLTVCSSSRRGVEGEQSIRSGVACEVVSETCVSSTSENAQAHVPSSCTPARPHQKVSPFTFVVAPKPQSDRASARPAATSHADDASLPTGTAILDESAEPGKPNTSVVDPAKCPSEAKRAGQARRQRNQANKSVGDPALVGEHESTSEVKKVRQARRRRNQANDSAEDPSLVEEHECTSEVKASNEAGKQRKQTKRKCPEQEGIPDDDSSKSKKVKLSSKTISKDRRLVSENFVKIDLRKKTFARVPRKLTGAQYKRREWKRKTSLEHSGTSKWKKGIGVRTCFKCGGEGHWAKFCRGPKKKEDPFMAIDAMRCSAETEHLNELAKGSCFDYLEVESTAGGTTASFSIDDVLDIKPCWPRIPFDTGSEVSSPSEPLFAPENGRPNALAYEEALHALQEIGYTQFREGQKEAVARIISGLSTLVILSTGSGKSLCYQLPAYMYFKQAQSLTLVVSPLVALMEDQVSGLPRGLKGACLHSNMTELQRKRVCEKLTSRQIAVLLVSPEALVAGGFGTGILPPKASLPPIAFACIDEAHCLSEWSHNFRPSYLRVCQVLRERYGISCLLGLTATASQTTAQSVIEHLGIALDGSIIRDPNPIPENLHITASRDTHRDQALVELLQMPPFSSCDSIIVYCTRRTEAERLASLLRTNLPDRGPPMSGDTSDNDDHRCKKGKSKGRGSQNRPKWWNVECYHAGLTPAQRRRCQKQFMSGELRIVVATVAFGMGLDKSDVRAVIHYNMPKSFENFVQEIGRAGRDGEASFCHLFLDDENSDLNELRRHTYASSVDRSTIRKFVEIVFPLCGCAKRFSEHAVVPDHARHSGGEAQEGIEYLSDGEMDLLLSQVDCVEESDASVGNTPAALPRHPSSFRDGLVNCHENDGLRDCASTLTCPRARDQQLEEGVDCSHPTLSQLAGSGTVCLGHRVSFSVDNTVLDLDMREEDVSTLLAYLELHSKKWLRVLNPIRSYCTIKCYGGPEQFQLLCRKFPPVAVALRYLTDSRSTADNLGQMRQIEFNIVDLCDAMCWDVFTVVRELRSLQWNMAFALDAPLNSGGKSGIVVEIERLSFHVVTAPGVDDNAREEICDFLHAAVQEQERTRLLQLNALFKVLHNLSCQHYWQVKSGVRVDAEARASIKKYFLCDAASQKQVMSDLCGNENVDQIPARKLTAISADIRSLLVAHPDQAFTGRAVARIFQGIDSPAYPATVFGRDRRFWRQYIDADFNELRVFATQELRRFRDVMR